MKIWIHKITGNLILSWHVYASMDLDAPTGIGDASYNLTHYQYMGEAIENEFGLTFVVGSDFLEHFEYVGML